MTDATENVVALVTAQHDLFRNGKRKCDYVVGEIVVRGDCALRARGLLSCGRGRRRRAGCFCFLAGEELGIRALMSAGYGSFDRLAHREAVGEERGAAIRFHLRLVLHIATTTDADEYDPHQIGRASCRE